jgi:hypothetical protein
LDLFLVSSFRNTQKNSTSSRKIVSHFAKNSLKRIILPGVQKIYRSKLISAKLPDNILAHSSTFRRWDLSRRGGRGGTGGERWNV